MFKHIHHHTWFPTVVIGLSLFLLLFIAWAYNNHQITSVEDTTVLAITMSQYQNEVSGLFVDFWDQYRGQSDPALALQLISNLEQKMLALKVPGEGQSVHFELVSSLELMRQGLIGNEEKLQAGLERLEKTLNENSWITGK